MFNGPPNVTFRWRHWGEMAGPYAGYAATGKVIDTHTHIYTQTISPVIALYIFSLFPPYAAKLS